MKVLEKIGDFFRGVVVKKEVITRLKENDKSLDALFAHQIVEHGFKLADQDIEALCAALTKNTQVTQIDFSRSHGKITDVSATFIAELLKRNNTIQHIDLSYNHITDEGVKAITQVITSKKQSKVASINLSGSKISIEGVLSILQILRNPYYPGIRITLRDNRIDNQGAIAIAQSIEKNKFSSFFIDLNSNEIGGNGAQALFQVCDKINWEGIKSSHQELEGRFSTVSLKYNPIGDMGVKYKSQSSAKSIKGREHTFIKENYIVFDFSYYSITHQGVINIADSFAQLSAPFGFDLSNNKIGPEGAAAIEKLLLCNSEISYFMINNNKIGLAGALVVARFLEHNNTLTRLFLRDCVLSDAGIVAIAKSLEKNNTLTEAFLGNENENGGGQQALLNMLQKNTTLVKLYYYSKNNDYNLERAINTLLERNRNIAIQIKDKKEATQVAPPTENKEKRIIRQPVLTQTSTATIFTTYNPIPTIYSFFNYLTPLPEYLLALPMQFITTVSTYITPQANAESNEASNSSHSTQQTTATTTSIASHSTLPQNITIPAISLEIINQLSKEGINIAESLNLLSTFHAKHEILKQALLAWEKQAEKDATEKAELEIISQDPEVKYYYQMMKSILERILMAAIVIASGKVSSDSSFLGKVFEGLCTLAGAAFLEAVPALGFIKMAASTLDSTITYREMQQHLRWVELKDIPEFAALLARRLALAKKPQIVAGINHSEKLTWEKIKGQCSLIAEELKSGKTLSDGERRALLDAQDLFKYMLSHDAPSDMTLNGRVNLLLQQMVGSQYVYTPPAVAVSSSTTKHDFIETAGAQPNVTKQEIEQLRQELSTFKTAHEKNQQSKQEQAQQILELERKLHMLQQKLIQPEISYIRDNENGTMSVQNRILFNTTQGPVPIEAILKSFQQQLAQMSEAVAGTALVVHQLQGQQGGNGNIDKQMQAKKKEEEKNKQERKALFGFF